MSFGGVGSDEWGRKSPRDQASVQSIVDRGLTWSKHIGGSKDGLNDLSICRRSDEAMAIGLLGIVESKVSTGGSSGYVSIAVLSYGRTELIGIPDLRW